MGMKFSLARIGEWLSPDFQQPSATELWLLLVLALGLSGRVRSPLLRLVLLLSLVHLALKHQRNIAVLGRVAPFLIAAPSAPAPMITPRAAVEAAMAAGGKGKVLNEYAFGGFLGEHGFGWSLLAPGTSAIAVLDELPGWRRVYADDTAVVHVRADTAPAR
ncbi:hypothetical protein [Variovorax sp. RA8]|uniref:hypothetical protein n=1 Tax=Variovorax sp. (strain JCM 16519 / RA8) TaxID=662548 RepID=UPI001315FE35|nr:hypothetical protein [Variovorax sp. RA8]VTU19962.1 hypothetical protein RA8CHR_02035 [Variovorax sp. RA8]